MASTIIYIAVANEIIVINKGRLVGKGKYKELIENNKYYQLLQK